LLRNGQNKWTDFPAFSAATCKLIPTPGALH
jgi:hypothetical protein